jgi:uncharacterized membrane protein
MKEGIAIIEQTGESARSIFIDQEALECARLNMRTKNRIAKADQIRQTEKAAKDRIQRKEKAARAKFEKFTMKTIFRICADLLAVWAFTEAGAAELIHPVLCTAAVVIGLCAASLRLGVWVGRVVKKCS